MPTASPSSEFHGQSLIDGRPHPGTEVFRACEAATGKAIDPAFHEADDETVDEAARLAERAAPTLAALPPARRARLLETIADHLEARGDALTARAGLETGLPAVRLQGELGRTTGQLRLFASTLREDGDGPERRVDAQPEREPLPRPALVQRYRPVGPVAVFGASNFPLAFSVAGGDTAAALAAGCPVVVKGHPAHPGTSELTAQTIADAVEELDLPAGAFALLQSSRNEVAAELVRHPAIRAVGFTGSLTAGRALCDVAAARPDPIPVYAEMGSINPVFLLPGALAERAEALGAAFAQSLLMGEGQFCTNPGLLVAPRGDDLETFIAAVGAVLAEHQPAPMLTRAIATRYREELARRRAVDGVAVLAEGPGSDAPVHGTPAALDAVGLGAFLDAPELQDEVFGPAALLVRCDRDDDLARVAEALRGQLTATLLVADIDRPAAEALLPRVERLAGRVLFNGFPTGVEVSPAMVHGGPWPATSDGRCTSVGTRAMERFQRLVCYQDAPAGWLGTAGGESP